MIYGNCIQFLRDSCPNIVGLYKKIIRTKENDKLKRKRKGMENDKLKIKN